MADDIDQQGHQATQERRELGREAETGQEGNGCSLAPSFRKRDERTGCENEAAGEIKIQGRGEVTDERAEIGPRR